jgi:hypothetical protein
VLDDEKLLVVDNDEVFNSWAEEGSDSSNKARYRTTDKEITDDAARRKSLIRSIIKYYDPIGMCSQSKVRVLICECPPFIAKSINEP